MYKAKLLVGSVALLALGGCDYVNLGFGGNEVEGNQANISVALTNQAGDAAGGKPGGPEGGQAADAGVTSSRSLQGLANGGKPGAGGGLGAGGIEPGILVGTWSDNGDCNNPQVEFLADGSFRSFNGGGGQWQLDGSTLTLSGDGGTATMQLQSFDGRVLTALDPNGQPSRSTRC